MVFGHLGKLYRLISGAGPPARVSVSDQFPAPQPGYSLRRPLSTITGWRDSPTVVQGPDQEGQWNEVVHEQHRRRLFFSLPLGLHRRKRRPRRSTVISDRPKSRPARIGPGRFSASVFPLQRGVKEGGARRRRRAEHSSFSRGPGCSAKGRRGTAPAVANGGLTQIEAGLRARSTGPNEVAQEKPQSWPVRLLRIALNPLVILLTVLAGVSFATSDARAGTVMALMVALSVGLRFWQEARAGAAAAKLKAMIHVTATVVRDGKATEIPLRDLVPGDMIRLAAGDMIPGDVRVSSSKDLFVSQGSLAGESLPIEKFHDPDTTTASSPTELKNICFMAPASRVAPPRRWW